jgi:PncC family amidohydrolase
MTESAQQLVLPLNTAGRVAQLLKDRQHTIAIAESSAGGLISASLLAVPGASAYFLGGGVIYTQRSRQGLLNITDHDMTGLRSSSEPYALLLARTVKQRLGATWALAETGAAGPTGNRYGDAAGHACFAVAGPLVRSGTLETGSPDRIGNMHAFTEAALQLLVECLENST